MTAKAAIDTLKTLAWTEVRIAAKVGCSQPTINQISRGKREPMKPLADALMLLAKKEQRKADRKAHGTHAD